MRTFALAALFFSVFASRGVCQTTAVDFFNRAAGKYGKGDLDGAIADCTRAIELNPKYAHAYYNRGITKKAEGDLEGANADLDSADKLRGDKK